MLGNGNATLHKNSPSDVIILWNHNFIEAADFPIQDYIDGFRHLDYNNQAMDWIELYELYLSGISVSENSISDNWLNMSAMSVLDWTVAGLRGLSWQGLQMKPLFFFQLNFCRDLLEVTDAVDATCWKLFYSVRSLGLGWSRAEAHSNHESPADVVQACLWCLLGETLWRFS